jgi:Domain of unknown function (DUF1929)
MALGLATVIWLALAPTALAHGSSAAQHVKLDPTEVATLGVAHARVHALEREAARESRARWNELTPSQRRERIRASERAEQRLNRSLAAKPRDDIGYWESGLRALPEAAINLILMPTSEFLYFGREPLPQDGGPRPNFGDAAIFNPRTGQSRRVDPPPIPESNGLPANLFCAGQALLSDGRVLIVGGQLRDVDDDHVNYSGLQYTFLFDPWKEKAGENPWTVGPKMSAGRWYPSAAKLPSGDVVIMSGLDENGQGAINPQMDIFRSGIDDSATSITPYPAGFRGPSGALPPDSQAGYVQSLYPRLFTLPDGNVLLAGPGVNDSAKLDTPTAIDPLAPLGSGWTQFSTQPSDAHFGGPAVLEPDMTKFGGSWTALLMSGIDPPPGIQHATRTVERINADPAGTPGWQPADPAERLNTARYYDNDVLLPDGGMVVLGGGSGFDPTTSVGNYYIANPAPPQLRQVELRRPGERTWRLGAAQQEWRTYHSTAALLPDGRVVSAGDDYHEGPDPFLPLPATTRRDSAEFYWPPYLFNGDTCAPRPVIRGVGTTSAPSGADDPWAVLTYAEPFGIFSEHARPGMQAVLVAPAATTHAFDMNQRVIPLKVTSTITGGGLNVRTPANASIAQSGWYMLFVVDADGTPSIARWVKLLAPEQAIPERGGKVPATVSGTWPSPKPRMCGNPDGTTVTESDGSAPPPTPPAPVFTAKLAVKHAVIRRSSRTLNLLASITQRASGKLRVGLFAGSKHRTFTAAIDSIRGRVLLNRKVSKAVAKLGTGIVTVTYDGDADTRSQSVRLRAAAHAAKLKMKRPTLTSGGVVKARGTISPRARGVVRVQLQYEFDGKTRTVELHAKVAKGAWKLNRQLTQAVRDEIAGRTGTVHSYTLFTGYKPAGIRGEMQSFELLGDP